MDKESDLLITSSSYSMIKNQAVMEGARFVELLTLLQDQQCLGKYFINEVLDEIEEKTKSENRRYGDLSNRGTFLDTLYLPSNQFPCILPLVLFQIT